ncbi:unnamed protein product [Durusdinium trenchii]|uniref:Uncharacterized protein n=2 Tax=Durusdinium trenchii TaxID=1381693 RepID=A0ABP0PV07_9DINO
MSSMPDEFKLLRVSLQWLPWSARPSSGCFFPCPPATSGFPRMGDFPVDPAERASSPQSEAASGVAEGEESENASERLSGNAVDLRRALVRKVAQLTKVVMHLTSLNDADEKQYEELQAELECEVQLVMEKALKEMDAERHKLTELADKTCLQENSRRLEQLFGPQRQSFADELRRVRLSGEALRAKTLEAAERQLAATRSKVRDVSEKMQDSLQRYRQTLALRAKEMQQRHEELRQDRQAELQVLEQDFERRLDELRGSLRREAEHAKQSTEHAMLHMRRMHEAETSSWQMQALQRRQERIQRLELDFAEERRRLEQHANSSELELGQLKKDLLDFKASYSLVDQQVDAMRGTLDEMRLRAERAQADADTARAEAAQAEVDAAALAKEIALLEVRQRSAGIPPGVMAPLPPNTPKTPKPANGLTDELREAIGNSKQLEHEIAQLEAELGDLEDELAEKDKTVEILELETEEERLRTHRLQARILQVEASLT